MPLPDYSRWGGKSISD